MSLQEKLEAQRKASAGRIPAEKRAIMERVTTEQRAPEIIGRALKVGDSAPPFALPDHDGREVSLAGLRQNGPVVVSFFRGAW